ncbi:MAG TPA: protein phosphatase 2C domain-containing protein [Candidatus Dormibacteraeota bacterium]|nr:protein phosphatase 2C domain-containing protein [Candidatus Dormibacteraeota bacterium]
MVDHTSQSETGPVRPHNEDHLGWGHIAVPAGASEKAGAGLVFAVADGLGAYGGGDVASELAVTTLLRHAETSGGADVRPTQLLRAAFEKANMTVFHAALEGQGTRRMQTTMLALVLSPGEVHMGHVGDCRAYRLRGDGIEVLSTDHTQAMDMLRMRLITPEQASDHPARHALTRSLGAELIARVDLRKETLQPGDSFLLCSDGLWGKLALAEIRDALAATQLDDSLARLIDLAVQRGGEDNASGIALRVVETPEAPARPQGWRRFFL